jgi:hypothetical protein
MTWFRMHGNVVWLDRSAQTAERELIAMATEKAKAFLEA